MIAYILVLVGFITAGAAPIVVANPYPTRDSCERAMVDVMHNISTTGSATENSPVAFCRKVEKPEKL